MVRANLYTLEGRDALLNIKYRYGSFLVPADSTRWTVLKALSAMCAT